MQINLYNESLFGDGGGDTPANIQPVKSVTITENGTTSVAPDAGFDGLEGVSIETNVAPKLQTKSVEVTENGTTSVAPDAGFDGLEGVSIETNVAPKLQTKSVEVTENGTTSVAPDAGFDGLSKVDFSVNVSNSGGGEKPSSNAKGVFFFDYNGDLLYSYTIEEARALTALPEVNTTHAHLVSDGWTHTLAQVKAVKERLDVGALYTPSQGQVGIIVDIPYPNTKVTLPVWGAALINWGDGSNNTINPTESPSHTYATPGKYKIYGVGGVTFRSTSETNPEYACIEEINLGFRGTSEIPVRAFYNLYNLRRVSISKGYTSIGSNTFNNCYSLTSVVIPEGVTSIGDSAFRYCYSLTSVVIPEGVTSIGSYAFSYCYSLTSVVIPEGVTSIRNYTFEECYSLTSVVIPEGVTSIGDNTFSGCYSLTSVVIPESVTSIGSGAFNGCYSLTSVVIPESVTSIRNYAFNGCYSLTSVVIPEGVTSIGSYAFRYCYSLTSVVIPEGVTSIGDNTFNNCSFMQWLISKATTPPALSSVNALGSNNTLIYVPDASVEAYKVATNWATLADRIHPMSEIGL